MLAEISTATGHTTPSSASGNDLLPSASGNGLLASDELKGNDHGAPQNPKIGKKFLITTLITSIMFLAIYYLVNQNYLNLRGYLQ